MEALDGADVGWMCDLLANPPSEPFLPSPALARLMGILHTESAFAFRPLRDEGEDTLIAALVKPEVPQEVSPDNWRNFAMSWGWEGRYLSGLGERLAQTAWYQQSIQAWLSDEEEKAWLTSTLLETSDFYQWSSTIRDIIAHQTPKDRLETLNDQAAHISPVGSFQGLDFQVRAFTQLSAEADVDLSSWSDWWCQQWSQPPSEGLPLRRLLEAIQEHVVHRGDLPPGLEWNEEFFHQWGRLLGEKANLTRVEMHSVQSPQGDQKIVRVNEAFFIEVLLKTLAWPAHPSCDPASLTLKGVREAWPSYEADLDQKSQVRSASSPEVWAAWKNWRLTQSLESASEPVRRPRM